MEIAVMEKGRRSKLISRLPIILAFVLPVLIMVILYIGRNIFPFGENMFLRSDMYHQYAPFMKEFQRNLQQGGSMLFSWNIGLGTNFVSTYAYYLASPVNWLVGLFPDTLIPEFMNLMIILKAGAMSALFTWYVIRKFDRISFAATAFGCFYAMSSYMAAFSWNVMWLDCLLLLPLILMGLEALVKQGKVRMYTISLAVCIFSNYYISIMICIFLVFYFVYLLICEKKSEGSYMFVQRCCLFILYSILAGCIAMVMVLPAFYNLFITASSNSAFPKKMTAYYNVLEMLSKSVINTEPAVFSGHFPNIYSTMAAFMLLPLYWLSDRISGREKVGKTALICLLAFSFMFNIPTYIWHGMHFPNSLPCRYSFIFIFLVLVMGYEAFINIRQFKTKYIVISAAASIAFVFLLQAIYTENMTVETACVAAIFIIVYLIISMMVRNRKVHPVITIVLLMIVASVEIMVNTNETGYSTTSRTSYMSDNEAIGKMLEQVKDGSFFRTEKVTRRTKNDGSWLDYNSASIFSSTTVAGDSDLYSSLGMQGRTNAYSFYGHTPVTQALLGVKYEIASSEQDDNLMTLKAQEDSYYLYENKYALSIGYMVNSTALDMDMNSGGPFAYQNQMIYEMTGVQNLYTYFGVEASENVKVTADTDGRFLAYVTTDLKKVTAEITRDEEVIYTKTFESMETPQIIDVGDVKAGDIISLVSADSEKSQVKLDVTAAFMNNKKYNEAMEILSGNQLMLTKFSDTELSGTVSAGKDQILFTTIPYDESWTVYVDGVKAEYRDFKDAFIILELEAGEHLVEFRYWPKGLTPGALISIIALLAFIASEVIKKIMKRKKNDESEAEEEAAEETDTDAAEESALNINEYIDTAAHSDT